MREGWKEVLLGDLLKKIIGGGTPSKSKPEYWNGKILWCSVKDMQDDKFAIFDTADRISDLGLKNSSSNLILKGTVITSTRMGLGRAFIAERDMAINQDLKALIPNDKVDNKFLLWLIVFNRNNLENLGTGSTVKGIRLETLKSIKINLPPLKTQRKIASILSAYDDLIENNLKRIKLLEEQAQQTYEEWFVRMKFPGYETAVFDEESGLPVGWELRNLGEVIEITSSKRIFLSDYVSEGIPFFRGKEIILKSKNEALNDRLYISVKKFSEIKAKYDVPTEGDILVTAVGTLGYPYLVTKSDGDFYFKDGNLIWLKGNKKISSSYLISSFKNEHFQTMLINIAIGSSQKALTIKSLNAIKHIIPELSIQKQYDNIVIPIYNSIENLQNQNQLLKEARDVLLPRLMSGVIDPSASSGQIVEHLEIDGDLSLESYREVAEGNSEYKINKK